MIEAFVATRNAAKVRTGILLSDCSAILERCGKRTWSPWLIAIGTRSPRCDAIGLSKGHEW